MYENCGLPDFDIELLVSISAPHVARARRATHEEEERGKDEAEKQRSCQVGVVHDVRVDFTYRIHDREGLLQNVVEVDAQFCGQQAGEVVSRGSSHLTERRSRHAPCSKGGSPSMPVHGVNAFHQFWTTICPPPKTGPLLIPPDTALTPVPLPPIAPEISGRPSGSMDGRFE